MILKLKVRGAMSSVRSFYTVETKQYQQYGAGQSNRVNECTRRPIIMCSMMMTMMMMIV